MLQLHRGLYIVVLCSWSCLPCHGIDVCTNDTSVSSCCPCPYGIHCNDTCPMGFEKVENTGHECKVESTNDTNADIPDSNCRRCPVGFYVDDDNSTHCCHPACRTCTGQGAANCTICMVEFDNTCVETCPNGHEEIESSGVYTTTTNEAANEATGTTGTLDSSNDSVTQSTDDVETSSSTPFDNMFGNIRAGSTRVCRRYPQNKILLIGLSAGGGIFLIIIITSIIVLVRKCDIGNRHKDPDVMSFSQTNPVFKDDERVNVSDIQEFKPETTENDFTPCEDVVSRNIRNKGENSNQTTEIQTSSDFEDYQVVYVSAIEQAPTVTIKTTEEDLNHYDDVETHIIPTNETSNSKPTEKNLQTYADVYVAKIPIKETSNSKQAGKGLHPYEGVEVKNIPSRKTAEDIRSSSSDSHEILATSNSKPTEKGLQTYADVYVDKIPIKETNNIKQAEKGLHPYEVVEVKNIPSRKTTEDMRSRSSGSHEILANGVDTVDLHSEKDYDDAFVGAAKQDSDIGPDIGTYGPA